MGLLIQFRCTWVFYDPRKCAVSVKQWSNGQTSFQLSTSLSFQLAADAADRAELTFEKRWLTLSATPGIIAPAETATNPAIKAYSMRSCPQTSLHSWAL